jgi:hypothetical protein
MAYGRIEILRNYLIYTVVALVPAQFSRWELSPMLVACLTILLTGVFGITGSGNPLFWVAREGAGAFEVTFAAALTLTSASAVVWRSARR